MGHPFAYVAGTLMESKIFGLISRPTFSAAPPRSPTTSRNPMSPITRRSTSLCACSRAWATEPKTRATLMRFFLKSATQHVSQAACFQNEAANLWIKRMIFSGERRPCGCHRYRLIRPSFVNRSSSCLTVPMARPDRRSSSRTCSGCPSRPKRRRKTSALTLEESIWARELDCAVIPYNCAVLPFMQLGSLGSARALACWLRRLAATNLLPKNSGSHGSKGEHFQVRAGGAASASTRDARAPQIEDLPWHRLLANAFGVAQVEIRCLPALAHCFPRSFTFYVAHPIRSIHRKSLLI